MVLVWCTVVVVGIVIGSTSKVSLSARHEPKGRHSPFPRTFAGYLAGREYEVLPPYRNYCNKKSKKVSVVEKLLKLNKSHTVRKLKSRRFFLCIFFIFGNVVLHTKMTFLCPSKNSKFSPSRWASRNQFWCSFQTPHASKSLWVDNITQTWCLSDVVNSQWCIQKGWSQAWYFAWDT